MRLETRTVPIRIPCGESGRTTYRLPRRVHGRRATSASTHDLVTLDAAVQHERADWIRLWRATGREPFAHPTFGQLFATPGDRVVAVADVQHSTLLPLRLRPIPEHPGHFDATGPYGYGGAYCDSSGRPTSAAFWRGVEAWGREHSVVTLFSRLHMLDHGALRPPEAAAVTRSINYVRSLDLDDDALLADVDRKVRKNMRRAVTDGVSVRFTQGADGFEDFLRIYGDTMERRMASDFYRFDRAFFERIHRDLAGSFVYAYAQIGGKVVSCELVLLSDRNAYSFLGGTDMSAYASRPNDFLKIEIMRWCRNQGIDDFVLGGGATPGDGIERYKRAFAPGGARAFRTLQLVLDADAEQTMSRGYERGYFPAYRGTRVDPPVVPA